GAAGTGGVSRTTGNAGTTGSAGTWSYDAAVQDGPTIQNDAGGGMSNPDANCGALSKGAVKLPPDILIVFDASLSMNATADNKCMNNGGADSKWSQMSAALGTVVTTTDTTVNWGLKFFADDAACTVGPTVNVEIGPMTGSAITTAITGRTQGMGNVRNG